MNVILQGDGKPYGVLEVDSRSEDEFEEHDLAFLQGSANILGMAIERERHERNLNAALDLTPERHMADPLAELPLTARSVYARFRTFRTQPDAQTRKVLGAG